MKTRINKSTKKVLSLILAFAVFVGTFFVTNVGVNINTKALNSISQWDGVTFDTELSGDGTQENPYKITNAAELAAVCYGRHTGSTTGKYFKVEGVSEFYMDNLSTPATVKALSSSNDVNAHYNAYIDAATKPTVWQPNAEVTLKFDGNGATVYGLYMVDVAYAGLFHIACGGTEIKNIIVRNSYIYNDEDFAENTNLRNAGFILGSTKAASSSESVKIKYSVARSNYGYGFGGRIGEIVGQSFNTKVEIDTCLAVDNDLYYRNSYTASIATVPPHFFVRGGWSGTVTNSIGFGAVPQIRGLYNATTPVNNYCVGSIGGVDGAVDGTHIIRIINADDGFSFAAKENLTNLNWADNINNGEGYWHVIPGDYPSPIKPEGWKEVTREPVWDGTAAEKFESGSGTEKDPFIIKTAEQLYKMVLDGGKFDDGTPAYYKVSPDVTDIYLNSIQGGTLQTLKDLVEVKKSANNWTKAFNSNDYKADNDGDGLADEKQAFTGVFDGNGVTIHGLYSSNAYATGVVKTWLAWGTGFVPAVKYNAVIKNVNFDKTYICNEQSGYAGVITASIGLDTSNGGNCTTTNASFYNIAVRNTYMHKGGSSAYVDTTTQEKTFGAYTKGGLVAAHGSPGSLSFVNCVYDGVGSELVYDTNDHTAGIFAAANSASKVKMIGCVSIGLQPLACSLEVSLATMVNCYTTKPLDQITDNNNPSAEYLEAYVNNLNSVSAKSNYDNYVSSYFEDNTNAPGVKVIEEKDQFSNADFPLLNWGIWSIKSVENNRTLPMPSITKGDISGYVQVTDMICEQVGGAGNFNYSGGHEKGTYGQFYKLVGSGTANDPYIIHNALELANAISTGGINISQPLHYKLICDINLSSLNWIHTGNIERIEYKFDSDTNQYALDENGNKIETNRYNMYKYVPFKGVLDGNGHTIYELNATAPNSGALIPVLDGGTVKNLHIRNSAAKTAIFGVGNGTIENCSAENCYVADNDNALILGENVNVVNSYCNDAYYLENGEQVTPIADGTTWYKAGVDGKPRLVSNAKNMPCADIDGDGKGDSYGAADVVALRNYLLEKDGFEYIYGDVSGNGVTNLSDLVILTRSISDTYNGIQDGFWRNLELGNLKIYYGENDNYDAARKLELYLEAAVSGVDIIKVVSAQKTFTDDNFEKDAVYVHSNDIVDSTDGQLEIIVGNISNSELYADDNLKSNQYSITYDKQNGVLWLKGENFTAVEQAVIDFISNSDASTSTIYTVEPTLLDEKKWPVEIDGTIYYYTWGDEFDDPDLLLDNWQYSSNTTESEYEKYLEKHPNATTDLRAKYLNLETALAKDISKLYVFDEGKLSMRRGVYKTDAVQTYKDDYEALGYIGLEVPTDELVDGNGEVKNGFEDTINISSSDYDGNATNDDSTSDIFVSGAKLISQKSLLVKQGYFEFMASLPSDGHAFPSWWMMGDATGGNNNAYTESLFGKVYKLNQGYTGGNAIDITKYETTCKYQYPNAFFEIDIIELMQDITNFDDKNYYDTSNKKNYYNFLTGDTNVSGSNCGLVGVYDYNLPINMHKYYDLGVSGGKYHYIDWEKNKRTEYALSTVGITADKTIRADEQAVAFKDRNTYKAYYTTTSGLSSKSIEDMQYSANSQKILTTMRRYGFKWEVNGSSYKYTLYVDRNADGKFANVYVDKNGDGDTVDNNECEQEIFVIEQINYAEKASDDPVPDVATANQYMYFLIDNKFYTANQYYHKGVTVFKDLLTKEYSDEKTTLDIEYMRVYQADDHRDIVTPETENFNNGNHFGY